MTLRKEDKFELPVRERRSIWLSALLGRQVLGMGRCALSVFGQHDALHQIGVDPTAEAAIRAGDDTLAEGPAGWREPSPILLLFAEETSIDAMLKHDIMMMRVINGPIPLSSRLLRFRKVSERCVSGHPTST